MTSAITSFDLNTKNGQPLFMRTVVAGAGQFVLLGTFSYY